MEDAISKNLPVVESAEGHLPILWERQVIFVANLLSLFFGNESETGELMRQVGPLETYGGRLVPILDLLFRGQDDNVVLLERAPNQDLMSYFRCELGIRLPRVHLLSHHLYRKVGREGGEPPSELMDLLAFLRTCPGACLDGFVTDSTLERLGRLLGIETLSPVEASHRGNNKLLLHQYLVSRDLPVFDTEIAGSESEISGCLRRLRTSGYRSAVVKAQIGASGIGIRRLNTSGPGEVPAYLFFEGPCLVQGWLDAEVDGVEDVRSPSVQLFLGQDSVHLYDLTEQILSLDSIHEGNVSPPPGLGKDPNTADELFRQAAAAGRWLHGQGYRGTASVDFHVASRGGRAEVRICEINARVTGATYPAILARHFAPEGAWLMRNLRFEPGTTGKELLDRLSKADVLYRPGMPTGVLPINFNTHADGRVGKGQFLCLGPESDLLWGLLAVTRDLLDVRGDFDRD